MISLGRGQQARVVLRTCDRLGQGSEKKSYLLNQLRQKQTQRDWRSDRFGGINAPFPHNVPYPGENVVQWVPGVDNTITPRSPALPGGNIFYYRPPLRHAADRHTASENTWSTRTHRHTHRSTWQYVLHVQRSSTQSRENRDTKKIRARRMYYYYSYCTPKPVRKTKSVFSAHTTDSIK